MFLSPVLFLSSFLPCLPLPETSFSIPVIFSAPILFFTFDISGFFLLPGCFSVSVFAAAASLAVLFLLSVSFSTDLTTEASAPTPFLEGAFLLPVFFLALFWGFFFSEAGFPCFPPPSPGASACEAASCPPEGAFCPAAGGVGPAATRAAFSEELLRLWGRRVEALPPSGGDEGVLSPRSRARWHTLRAHSRRVKPP